MSLYEYGLFFILSLSTASFDFHRRGWLDKVVEYHKNKLFEDFQKVPNIEIKATVQPAPDGYVDSPAWDFDAVTRLIILIQQSKAALPARRVLRRMLGNTRRKMSFQDSLKFFPSLAEETLNDIYYDSHSGEFHDNVVTEHDIMNQDDSESSVILVSNPVESRLPSAMISINLLRNILEERAKAGRYMPTTKRTIPWKSKSKTTSTASSTAAQNTTQKEGGAATTRHPEGHTGTTGGTGATGNETHTDTTVAAGS